MRLECHWPMKLCGRLIMCTTNDKSGREPLTRCVPNFTYPTCARWLHKPWFMALWAFFQPVSTVRWGGHFQKPSQTKPQCLPLAYARLFSTPVSTNRCHPWHPDGQPSTWPTLHHNKLLQHTATLLMPVLLQGHPAPGGNNHAEREGGRRPPRPITSMHAVLNAMILGCTPIKSTIMTNNRVQAQNCGHRHDTRWPDSATQPGMFLAAGVTGSTWGCQGAVLNLETGGTVCLQMHQRAVRLSWLRPCGWGAEPAADPCLVSQTPLDNNMPRSPPSTCEIILTQPDASNAAVICHFTQIQANQSHAHCSNIQAQGVRRSSPQQHRLAGGPSGSCKALSPQ
jgi:hypothetical protein